MQFVSFAFDTADKRGVGNQIDCCFLLVIMNKAERRPIIEQKETQHTSGAFDLFKINEFWIRMKI